MCSSRSSRTCFCRLKTIGARSAGGSIRSRPRRARRESWRSAFPASVATRHARACCAKGSRWIGRSSTHWDVSPKAVSITAAEGSAQPSSQRRSPEASCPTNQRKFAAMMIVDAQIHLWAKGTPSAHHRQTPYLKDEALAAMDAAGVDRAVIHPVMWDPDSNELAVEAARAHPDRFAIMGWVYLDQPDQRALLETWKSRPGMKGLRFYFSDPRSQSWPDDGALDWLFPVAERLNIPVSLQASAFLPRVAGVAQRHPGLRISIDHMGVPRATTGADAAYRNLPQLLALAQHPNVAVKATGQGGYALDPYPFRSIHDSLHRVFDAFGPRRMFWGTDITRMHCTWRQCVTLFTEELPWLHGADLDLVMGQAFCDWTGWQISSP